jgi:hypothetical protein
LLTSIFPFLFYVFRLHFLAGIQNRSPLQIPQKKWKMCFTLRLAVLPSQTSPLGWFKRAATLTGPSFEPPAPKLAFGWSVGKTQHNRNDSQLDIVQSQDLRHHHKSE